MKSALRPGRLVPAMDRANEYERRKEIEGQGAQGLRKLSVCAIDIWEASNVKGSRTCLPESGFLGGRHSYVQTRMLRLGVISF